MPILDSKPASTAWPRDLWVVNHNLFCSFFAASTLIRCSARPRSSRRSARKALSQSHPLFALKLCRGMSQKASIVRRTNGSMSSSSVVLLVDATRRSARSPARRCSKPPSFCYSHDAFDAIDVAKCLQASHFRALKQNVSAARRCSKVRCLTARHMACYSYKTFDAIDVQCLLEQSSLRTVMAIMSNAAHFMTCANPRK